jgi:hypothetical protein
VSLGLDRLFTVTEFYSSYDNLFRFPSSLFESFSDLTGWKNDSSLVPPDLHIVEPGLNYPTDFNGSLLFTLQGGLEVEIPSYEMAGPLRGIDRNGRRVLHEDITTVNIFNEYVPENTATLGKVFLSQESPPPYHLKRKC